MGKKIDYVNISDEEARGAMKEAGLDDWLINHQLDIYEYFRKGYASQVSSAVEEVTGRKPTTFIQFTKDYVDAFK